MIKKTYFLFFSFFLLAINYLLLYRFLGDQLAWLSFPLTYLLLQWINLSVLKSYYVFKKFSPSRLNLNLKISKSSHDLKYYFNILKFKIYVLVFSFLGIIYFFMQQDFKDSYSLILHAIKFSKPVLHVEYPYFLGIPSDDFYFNSNTEVTVDTASYLELRIENFKKNDEWTIEFFDLSKNNINPKSLYYSTKLGNWSSSVDSLYHVLINDNLELAKNFEKLTNSNLESKHVKMELTNKNKKYSINIKINPLNNPLIKLEPVLSQRKDTNNIGKIDFLIEAVSQIPLSGVELSVRTKSGYNFKKIIAEFANSSEFRFKSDNVELITLGIPFLADDILYVKAVAKTVLNEHFGESQEISFPVQSPTDIIKDLIKNLTLAKQELNLLSSENSIAKQKSIVKLMEAAQQASRLSRSGVVRKNIIEAINYAEQIKFKKDQFFNGTQAKIQSTLNLLLRQKKSSETNNFFAKLLKLKNEIFTKSHEGQEFKELESDATELKELALQLKNQIKDDLQKSINSLSDQEEKSIKSLIKKDETTDKLQKTIKNLQQHKILDAQQSIQSALEHSTAYLANALQLLQQARQRAIMDARTKLQKSDQYLEETKSQLPSQKILSHLLNSKDLLKKIAPLGKEFNEALNEAQEHLKSTFVLAQQRKNFERLRETRMTQEAIEKALLSLQDEEENEKEMQKERDARTYRSAMDILAAQGTLDASWRKKILEEISKLKSQGETAESPMIRYLESRLR